MNISFSISFGKPLMQFFETARVYEECFDARPSLECVQRTVTPCLQTGILVSDKQQC